MRQLILLSACILCSLYISAQKEEPPVPGDSAVFPYWIRMMQDPDADYNATCRAFDIYWEGRSDYQGNGWKVFKRWQYIKRNQVGADGRLPGPDHVLNAMENYRAEHVTESSNGNWTLSGPVAKPFNSTFQPTGLGRVNAIAFHPSDASVIYAGAPSGGLWRSLNGGASWSALTTDLPSLGISSILVDPGNTSVILIGTGDRDGGDAPGMGVFRSTDGGASWILSNNGMGNKTVGMMIRHPGNGNIVLSATSGGIYKSADGGLTWVLKSSILDFKDIRFKPGDPTIVFATESGKFYRSADSGETWTQVTSGVIPGTRMVIGVTPADPAIVYLVQTNGTFAGLLKSVDSGLNFTTRSTTPNLMDYSCNGSGSASQAWYDLCIAVDPGNADIIYAGGINTWKSVDGGVTWSINSHWVGSNFGTSCAPSVHADIHCLEWNPLDGRLYNGNDGGVYWSSNGGASWNDISSGLSIAQVYKIGVSSLNPSLVINGYQDNGTATATGNTFYTVIGGDGMECIIDHSDAGCRYGALYYGDIRRSINGAYMTIAKNGSNGITESGDWVTPYIQHATVSATLFAGYKNVWRTVNAKAIPASSVLWVPISSGMTANCLVLEQSPANTEMLYAAWDGLLKRTDNASATSPVWVTCSLPGGMTPTDLEAHPSDPLVIYATAGTKVYKSMNKGVTWNDISGTLPGITINCLVYDTGSDEGLYVGNMSGVFYRNATQSDWLPYGTGLPSVEVRELEITYNQANPAQAKIRAATYGRGLWESDLWSNPSYNSPVCQGGTIQLSCSGMAGCGMPGSTYLWTSSDNLFTSSQQSPVIGPGDPGYASQRFYVSVTHGGGGSGGYVDVIIHPPVELLPAIYNPACPGSDDGSLNLLVTGGVPPYNYLWNNGSSANAFSGLIAGIYSVTVSNGDGCSLSESWTLTDPPPIMPGASIIPSGCNGSSDGAINLIISGGTPPFSISWAGGDTLANRTGLMSGSYEVTVSDSHGCAVDTMFFLEDPGFPCDTLYLQNFTVSTGVTRCFEAIDQLVVAGSFAGQGGQASFFVPDGGSVNLAAGSSIRMMPGMAVDAGGYLHGYIVPAGPWCNGNDYPGDLPLSAVMPGNIISHGVIIYPNPFTIDLIIRFDGSILADRPNVEVRDISGNLVCQVTPSDEFTRLSLGPLSRGIYIVRIRSADRVWVRRMIKV